ncbi:MAG: DUF86 domain-containing protein [Alphaproteobacteria bacterium]|nr:DUF86 domain-containing protein [Alphaproteobacteria bacterium]
MPKHGPASDLLEIEAALKRIQSYIQGLDEAAFTASLITYDAVAMNLIVIGEAVNRIEPTVLEQEPTIPWRLIVGQRNRLAHGYEDIEPAWLWRTVSQDLIPLKEAIARLLARCSP